MYASFMWKCFRAVVLSVAVAWSLASCHTASRKAAAPAPEAEQAISEGMKQLYMTASAAPPQSPAQQKLILRMAEKASNGKELLLAMRAAVGVFPAESGSPLQSLEKRVRSTVMAKMLETATLDQLIDYASAYIVDAENARPLVERMLQLGNDTSDLRAWHRIRAAAFHLKVSDLERQAQARMDQLAAH